MKNLVYCIFFILLTTRCTTENNFSVPFDLLNKDTTLYSGNYIEINTIGGTGKRNIRSNNWWVAQVLPENFNGIKTQIITKTIGNCKIDVIDGIDTLSFNINVIPRCFPKHLPLFLFGESKEEIISKIEPNGEITFNYKKDNFENLEITNRGDIVWLKNEFGFSYLFHGDDYIYNYYFKDDKLTEVRLSLNYKFSAINEIKSFASEHFTRHHEWGLPPNTYLESPDGKMSFSWFENCEKEIYVNGIYTGYMICCQFVWDKIE